MKKTAATNSARSGSFHVEMDIVFSKLGSAMALPIVPMAPTKRIVKTKITRTKPSFQFQFSHKVSIIDLVFGIILFKSHKLIIPRAKRTEMINVIHGSHLGIVKCKSRGKDVMYWPGLSSDIERVVSQCATCALNSDANPKEPLIPLEIAERPWANISTDIFEFKGNNYLVTVDHYSKWPEVSPLSGLDQ